MFIIQNYNIPIFITSSSIAIPITTIDIVTMAVITNTILFFINDHGYKIIN